MLGACYYHMWGLVSVGKITYSKYTISKQRRSYIKTKWRVTFMTARTEASEAAYQKAKMSGQLESLKDITPIKEWVHWKLVPNKFPHDKLNTRHLMVVLKREVEPDDYWGISEYELYELWWDIFPELERDYHYFKINGSALRSIGNVPHIHVCDFLPEYV